MLQLWQRAFNFKILQQNKHIQIIGWGLAGATTAWELYKRNIQFTVYDSGENFSSRVAAGIVNPIVFKRLTLSWQADKLMPIANRFYETIEKMLNEKLISSKTILYPFNNFEDENNWSVKIADERYAPFIKHTETNSINGIKTKHGFGEVKTFGSVDTNLFLDASKKFLSSKGIQFITSKPDYQSLKAAEHKDTIFCEGFEIMNNPFFNYIPMKPTHGETLTIHCPNLNLEKIISKNLFIQPLGNNHYKIGSTYNWDMLEPKTTEAGKNDLLERLNLILDLPFEIVKHEAGIRPTISDRRPVVGSHPNHKNLHLLNGLGTKGVLIAPYCANVLVNYLIDKTPIADEINVKRFVKENH